MVTAEAARLKDFFPALTERQTMQMAQLAPLYAGWNARINVISRRDTEQLYVHHVLHSLAIAKFIRFLPGAQILDAGTGGGFPGIPLAILFPEAHFTLADATGKKIAVVQAIAGSIGLQNVTPLHARVETVAQTFDFVVSRAVAALPALAGWVWNKITPGGAHALPNGMICLKGGELAAEIAAAAARLPAAAAGIIVEPVSRWFPDDFFDGKQVVYIPKS